MGFWAGAVLGLIIGANVGVVVAGLLGAARRNSEVPDNEYLATLVEWKP
jgi:uncharacterized membrane-anchored protein YhcB (DUF1043 family)